MTEEKPLILVTGATGYIGGRLVPRLLERGYRVRCLVRDLSRVQGRTWHDAVEFVVGDVLDPASVEEAVREVNTAYYLVHSLGAGPDFSARDLQAARNFGTAAKRASVQRILYLGALGESGANLSAHLRSRQQTGDALRECGVPITEFRAGVIVGSGSLSFEMIRHLTERLPVMICPRWVYMPVQPIAIRNVLDYLLDALRVPESEGEVLEIGGADVVTYGEMLNTYAEVRGLKRWSIPVPVLTPRLSSYWVHFVTPIPAVIAQPLIEGLRNEVIVRDSLARRIFPGIKPIGYRAAVQLALEKLETRAVETAWSDPLSASSRGVAPVTLTNEEGMIIERRQTPVKAAAEAVYRTFTGIGGTRGWLYMNWAWRVRGTADRVFGGVGLRRGRRDADRLQAGDALDFWRVEAIEPGRRMLLRAEMLLPGKAWLQFDVEPQRDEGGALLTQTAYFAPKGLLGLAYWYVLYPIHSLIFRGMIQRVASLAEGPK